MRTITTIILLILFFFTLTLSAQVQQFVMDRSDPLTIQVDCQDYMFEINQASGVPLGYVQVGTEDFFSRDYSELSGSAEFSMNFETNIISFGNSTTVSKPVRIGIVELKDSPGGAFQVRVDGGKTTLCFPLGNETGEEEPGNRVQLLRTKDGRLAAGVNFTDSEGVLAGQYPGISENICMVLPLQETTPAKSLKFAKDSEGNIFALLQLRDGKARLKSDGDGKGNLGVTLLTPSDREKAEEIGVTVVMVN